MIQTGILKNGMRFVCDYMPDVETVTTKIIVKTGSRNEATKENGISHFLEHMAFKGTINRTAKQIAYDFENIGASFNAYTSKETTAYYSKNLKEYTEKAMEILVDMLDNSIFSDEELERERGVILQELAMTNDSPSDMIFEYFSNITFKNQPYGRSILGPAKNIKKFEKNDFLSYIEKNYRADNMVLSVAGNITFEEVERIANKYFIKSRSTKKTLLKEAMYTPGFFKKEKKLEQVQCAIGFEGISYYDKDRYKVAIMNRIFGSGMSSRLFQEIREIKGLCYSICSFNDATFDTGIFTIYTAVDPINTNKTIDAVVEEIKKMVDSGVSKEELERAKVKFKSSILMSLENTTSRASSNGNDILIYDKIITKEEIIEEINSINMNDVKSSLFRLISSSEPSVALYGKVKDTYDYEEIKEKFRV